MIYTELLQGQPGLRDILPQANKKSKTTKIGHGGSVLLSQHSAEAR